MFETIIRVKGKLDPGWSDWFEGLQVQVVPEGDTVLRGQLADRAAVYGVLSRLGSLSLTLVEVTCREQVDTGPPAGGTWIGMPL